MADGLDIRREIQRKSIHISTSIIPLAYFSIMPVKEHIFILCVIMTIGFLSADLLRLYVPAAKKHFLKIFELLLRENEISHSLTGATYLFMGMTLAVFLFPREIAVPVMLFLSIADPGAAIFGKIRPVKRVFHKSIGGLIAFSFLAVLVTLVFTDYGYMGIPVALCAAVIELVPVKVNDNLSIPVVSGYLFILIR